MKTFRPSGSLVRSPRPLKGELTPFLVISKATIVRRILQTSFDLTGSICLNRVVDLRESAPGGCPFAPAFVRAGSRPRRMKSASITAAGQSASKPQTQGPPHGRNAPFSRDFRGDRYRPLRRARLNYALSLKTQINTCSHQVCATTTSAWMALRKSETLPERTLFSV
jgi:hypothetical protein